MWQTRSEVENFPQKHDSELIKEEKRKEVDEEIRVQVDELMRTELKKLKAVSNSVHRHFLVFITKKIDCCSSPSLISLYEWMW